MQFEEALELEKSGTVTDYKTYMYKVVDGVIGDFICNASDAEQHFKEGWRMSIIDAWEMHDPKHIEKTAIESLSLAENVADESKVAMFEELVHDNEEQLNKLLNIDSIDNLDILKSIAELYKMDGEPLTRSINWNIKGRRTFEVIRKDLKKQLDKMGVPYGDSENTH